MKTTGTVRFWHDEEGWGVIDSPETPGGSWTHFSTVRMSGYKSLTVGQPVELLWEAPGQDGYPFRTVGTWPLGQQPIEPPAFSASDDAYASRLTITWDSHEEAN